MTAGGFQLSLRCQPKTIINGKGVRILDVNGNGLVDYLQCDAAGQCKAWSGFQVLYLCHLVGST
jgi:hypothetical protein